jgi:hypothetical protein
MTGVQKLMELDMNIPGLKKVYFLPLSLIMFSKARWSFPMLEVGCVAADMEDRRTMWVMEEERMEERREGRGQRGET